MNTYVPVRGRPVFVRIEPCTDEIVCMICHKREWLGDTNNLYVDPEECVQFAREHKACQEGK